MPCVLAVERKKGRERYTFKVVYIHNKSVSLHIKVLSDYWSMSNDRWFFWGLESAMLQKIAVLIADYLVLKRNIIDGLYK